MNEHTDKQLLDAFIRASHYLASTQSSENIFEKIREAASVLPDFTACSFYTLDECGSVRHHDCSAPDHSFCEMLESFTCMQTARQAIESSFFEITRDFHGNWTGFFPLVERNGCRVALVLDLGFQEEQPSSRRLSFLLAFCGIAGQALGRWRADNEVQRIQKQLKEILAERTTELEREREFSRLVLENLEAGVVACDAGGKLILFNHKTREWHGGMRPEDIAPEDWDNHYHITEPDGATPLPPEKNPLFRALHGEVVRDLQMAISMPGKPIRRINAWASPICKADGTFLGAVTISTDITDRVENEKRLQAMNEKLTLALARSEELARKAEAATELKSQFLANMSHELRTPMNGILGMAELLNSSEATEEQREYLDILTRSGQSLLTLIQDILDFSKIEAGQLEIHEESFTLAELVEPLEQTVHAQLTDHSLSYCCRVPDFPSDPLWGDVGRIRQILTNLLVNATKFTQNGGVTLDIETDAHEEEPGKFRIVFRIRDTGIGIDPAKQNLLFEKFSQLDFSNTRKYGGSGLGLAICRQLVDLMGGRIGVRSPLRASFPQGEGPGSEFWVELQLRSARLQQMSDFTASAPSEQSAVQACCITDPANPAARKKILVVEDNEVNQRMICMLLKKLGYDYKVAENGRLALDALHQESFDLILMDLQMPVMDGLSATRAIRALPPTDPAAKIPILAVTAHAYAEDRVRSLDAGCNEHLVKPVNRGTLKAALDRWLGAD